MGSHVALVKGNRQMDFKLTELHTFFGFGKGDRQMASQDKKKKRKRKKGRKKRKKREGRENKKRARPLDEWILSDRKTSFSLQSLLCKTLRSFAS